MLFCLIISSWIACKKKKGDNKIGTTIKGIGPAYMDKAARLLEFVADLLEINIFRERLERVTLLKRRVF